MQAFICTTCGTQYPPAERPPPNCPICDDERQYVPESGQRWLAYGDLLSEHANRIEEVEPGLWGVGVEPQVAIGQRALLVRTPAGNVLWDCVPVLTAEGRARLAELGGVRAVAVSHPHFYTGVALLTEAFGATAYLHAADAQHVTHPSPRIEHWDGERLELFGGVTLVRAGGHFAGGTVLHWADGAGGAGRAADLGHHQGRTRPQARGVPLLVPEPDPAARARGREDRGSGRAVRLRPHPRRLVGHDHPGRRQGRRAALGGALPPGDRGAARRGGAAVADVRLA